MTAPWTADILRAERDQAQAEAKRLRHELKAAECEVARLSRLIGTAAGYCIEPSCMGEAGHDGPHTSVDFRAQERVCAQCGETDCCEDTHDDLP